MTDHPQERTVYLSAPSPISYTLDGAAAATGISLSAIKRAIADGSLIAHYPTARPLILADELRQWVESSPTSREQSHG